MLLKFEERELTNYERVVVARLVLQMEQINVVLDGASQGGAWINNLTKRHRSVEYKLWRYLSRLGLGSATWRDERGRLRRVTRYSKQNVRRFYLDIS
jgi:hypothetical protein